MDTLSTLTEEAEACCQKAFRRALTKGPIPDEWTCPKCEQGYQAQMVGEIRFYEATVWLSRW